MLGDDKSGFQDAVQAAKGADLAVVVVGEQFGPMKAITERDSQRTARVLT